jgi:hypothetical protein
VTLYVHIVDGKLEDAGDLPTVPVQRLDTGQEVNLSSPNGTKWMHAAGWYDIADVDPAAFTDDPAKRDALTAALAATLDDTNNLQAFFDQFDQAYAALLSNSWNFLDAYSDRLWPGQQAAGASWPQFDTTPIGTTLTSVATYLTLRTNVLAARSEILRTQESYNTYAMTKLANLLRVVKAWAGRQIANDPSVVPPPDR